MPSLWNQLRSGNNVTTRRSNSSSINLWDLIKQRRIASGPQDRPLLCSVPATLFNHNWAAYLAVNNCHQCHEDALPYQRPFTPFLTVRRLSASRSPDNYQDHRKHSMPKYIIHSVLNLHVLSSFPSTNKGKWQERSLPLFKLRWLTFDSGTIPCLLAFDDMPVLFSLRGIICLGRPSFGSFGN